MRAKLVFLAGTLFAAVGVFASNVVPTDKPALVLKGRTLADVQANLQANTDIANADEVEQDFITREELMEILASYVTKADLRNAVADVIGEDEITGLFEGGN